MIQGLGMENGTKVTREIVAKNPGWTKDTTRFEIWDKIAQVAASKQIYIHPDVHVGKAQWCCNNTGMFSFTSVLQSLTVESRRKCLVRRLQLPRRQVAARAEVHR